MKDYKKIRANLNPEVEINEKDRNAYHFRWSYRRINPADPTHPVIKTEVRAIRRADYERFFKGDTQKLLRAMKVVGAEDAELVHDPTLPQVDQRGFAEVKPENFKKVDPTEVKKLTGDDLIAEARNAAKAKGLKGGAIAKFVKEYVEARS